MGDNIIFYCDKIYIRFTVVTIFQCTVYWIKYVHIVQTTAAIHPPKLFILQTETSYPFNSNFPFSPCPAPGNSQSSFCLFEFDCFRYLIKVQLYICPLVDWLILHSIMSLSESVQAAVTVFLTVVENPHSRRRQNVYLKIVYLTGAGFSLHPHMAEEVRELFGIFSRMALNPFLRALPS